MIDILISVGLSSRFLHVHDRSLTLLHPFGVSDVNKPPTANAGPDVVVHLPNRAAALDGSRSYDDHGIVEYEWSRDPKSPAAGVSVKHEKYTPSNV